MGKLIAEFNVAGDGSGVVASVLNGPLIRDQATVTNLLLLELLRAIRDMERPL